jgi:hypothetical protein
MAEDIEQETQARGEGDRRAKDRRKGDRRREDRRAPVPVWRRPWMLVLYGALGMLILLTVNRSRPPAEVATGPEDEVFTAPPSVVATEEAAPAQGEPAENARRMADYERLMAEGDAAKGRLLRVDLFCSSISQIALRGVDRVEAAVAELADGTGRVPAAECKWGPQTAEPRADVLLLVPPALAPGFAAAPMVDDGFVRRRRVNTTVEWVGRSNALALRTAMILRAAPGQAAR